jgi:hypothetical protein
MLIELSEREETTGRGEGTDQARRSRTGWDGEQQLALPRLPLKTLGRMRAAARGVGGMLIFSVNAF